jgi:cytochrome c-type biogenesis protein CcmH/NrfG
VPTEEDLSDVAARLTTHEQICAYRYESITERLKRIEYVVYAVAAAIVSAFLYLLVDNLHTSRMGDNTPTEHRQNLAK